MTPIDSRTWDIFIPLYRNLPPDLDEGCPSSERDIPSSINVRQELFDQHSVDGYVLCPGCLRTFDQEYLDLMDVDHRKPKSRGGGHTWDNIQLLCRTCNSTKHTLTNTLFLQRATIKEWAESIRAAGMEHPNDDLYGMWAYTLDIQLSLNPIAADNDSFPMFKLIDIFTLTLDAWKGITWKSRSQIVQFSSAKRFATDFLEQGVRIAVTRLDNRATRTCEAK